jgi:hypothetical protein
MSKKLVETYLKKYIANYSKDKLQISLLQGMVAMKELIINRSAVNQDLDDMNIPFKLKFGLIKNLKVDVSIFKTCIEEIVIEDFIIVFGPDPSKADRNIKLSDNERNAVIPQLVEKYKVYSKWQKEVEGLEARIEEQVKKDSVPDPKLLKELEKKLKELKLKRCEGVPKNIYKDMLKEEEAHYVVFAENPEIVYQTMEEKLDYYYDWFMTIKNNLDAKIRIKNLRIYYEDTHAMKLIGDKKTIMSFCLVVENLFFEKVV